MTSALTTSSTGSSSTGMSRRRFMTVAGASGAGLFALSALRPRYAFAASASNTGDVLVVVFNRGGMDGLNVVAPYRMSTYRSLRPTIRVKAPDEPGAGGGAGLPLDSGGAVPPFDLSGVFGMHPGMSAMHTGPWAAGDLAVVHAAGMPASESDTRSHFSSQRNWEAGTANIKTHDGFLARHLSDFDPDGGIGAIGRGSTLQSMLRGRVPAYAMSSIAAFGVRGFANNSAAAIALASMYTSGADSVQSTGADTLARTNLVATVPPSKPANGATYAKDALAQGLAETARLIRSDIGLRAVVIDDGGWDTHTEMGTPDDPKGRFTKKVTEFSNAMAAFWTDMGTIMDRVTVVTMSEFGRTINENSSGGTDHGRATSMFVMGRNVNGGVHGAFPSSIIQGPEGDLEVKNDFRRVISEVLSKRCPGSNLSKVFPGYTQQRYLGLIS